MAENTRAEANSAVRWRVPADCGLVWQRWEGTAAVFNPMSGETHYLSLIPMVALELLDGRAYSETELLAALAEYFDIPVDETLTGQVKALLTRYDGLGLIEICGN